MRKCVCLIGRPNVGKSTIFNRLIGESKSIILDTPGITRDRIYGNVHYNDRDFLLIDTGGIDLGAGDFNKDIEAQCEIAIDEADLIVFVVDGRSELNQNDYYIRDMLKKSGKKVIIAANKLDNPKMQEEIYNFYELGFPCIIPVSASHNIGFGDLLDEIIKNIPSNVPDFDTSLKFCVIGRPNVGKSSLINALLNENRSIVSNIAGTTRDAIDTKFKYNNRDFTVIDTAGMRKRGKIYETVEKYSLLRSLKAIDRSDVCVLVINAEEGIIEHDKHIAGYAIEAGKAIVIAVNKWDTVEDKDKAMKNWKEEIKYQFNFMPYAKIVFLSALTKKRLHTLMPEIIKANENAHRQISTSSLNKVITDAYSLNLPPSYKGKKLKIYFSNQSRICPPTFNIRVNSKGLIHFSYERYLENKIRENFDFTGTPIVLNFKNKGEQ